MTWDLSQERVHVENLVNQRFNFLLVFATIVAGVAVATWENAFAQLVILACGTYFSWHMKQTISRAQEKLDATFKLLRNDETHPYTVTTKMVDAKGLKGPEGRTQLHKIGRLIPERIFWLLFFFSIMSAFRVGVEICACLGPGS